MRRKIMVLFDPETEYAVRFMEYISRKGSIPLEIHVFTDFDRVKAYVMGGRAEILLVSERVMSDEISFCRRRQYGNRVSGIRIFINTSLRTTLCGKSWPATDLLPDRRERGRRMRS